MGKLEFFAVLLENTGVYVEQKENSDRCPFDSGSQLCLYGPCAEVLCILAL